MDSCDSYGRSINNDGDPYTAETEQSVCFV